LIESAGAASAAEETSVWVPAHDGHVAGCHRRHDSWQLRGAHEGIEKRWRGKHLAGVLGSGLILLPLLLALATVPSLGQVYGGASGWLLVQIAIYAPAGGSARRCSDWASAALAWRSGSPFLGMIELPGLADPMLALHPGESTPPRAFLLIGLRSCWSHHPLRARRALRDRDIRERARRERRALRGRLRHLPLSGVLSPMLQLRFRLRRTVQAARRIKARRRHGGQRDLGAGARGWLSDQRRLCDLPAVQEQDLGRYTAVGRRVDWIGSALMGLLWFGGLSIYGMGAAILGPLGGVVAGRCLCARDPDGQRQRLPQRRVEGRERVRAWRYRGPDCCC